MKERNYNIDLLRIVCCFSVVIIHYAAILWYDSKLGSFDWRFGALIDALVRFCVPVFYMISGALFLSKKEINMKKIFSKNILKILIIIAVWLPIHGIFSYYKYGNEITGLNSFIQIFKDIIDNQYQFWFLFPLLSMYICLPILKKISEDKKVTKYFIILFFIFQIIRQSIIPIIGNGYKIKIINLFVPDLVLGYIGYFLLGYYLFNNNLDKKKIQLSYRLGVLSVVIAIIGTVCISIMANKKIDMFFGYYMITTFFASIAVFNYFKYDVKAKFTKFIPFISECTMGIYIFHNLVKWSFEMLGVTVFIGPTFITIPVFSILNIIICIIITVIIKKIPFIGKWLV